MSNINPIRHINNTLTNFKFVIDKHSLQIINNKTNRCINFPLTGGNSTKDQDFLNQFIFEIWATGYNQGRYDLE